MMLVLSGTKDGREVVKLLLERGYPLIVTTATSYGASLIKEKASCTVISKKLNKKEMEDLMVKKKIKLLIDATHPYAAEVSENAMKACENANVLYYRYEREESKIDAYKEILQYVQSYEEAVERLKNFKGNILLTTGSKTLEMFANALDKNRLFPRVLPVSDVIKKCEMLRIKPSNIIAMQGPFSMEMNIEIIKKYYIDILVSKESGNMGGTLEKLEAARKMNIPVLLIKRPKIRYKNLLQSVEDLINKVSEIYG